MGSISIDHLFSWRVFLSIALLSLSVWQDLRTRKVPNTFLLVAFLISIVVVVLTSKGSGLMVSVVSLMFAIALSLPLYFVKALGAGDIKLFWTLSFLLPWEGVLNSLVAAILWGGLLGVMQIILHKRSAQLAANFKAIFSKTEKVDQQQLTKIPFTVPILLGYLSYLSISVYQQASAGGLQ